MKFLLVSICVFATIAFVRSEVCRVGAACTDGGKTRVVFKQIPQASDYIVEVIPTIDGPFKSTGDRTASARCKEPGWVTAPGGYQYLVIEALTDWETAAKLCRGESATLPRQAFKNEEMFNFFRSYLKNQKEWAFWLPLSDRGVEGTWMWEDGGKLSHSDQKYWQEGQPDNWGEQDCAYMNRDTEKWDDGECHGKMSVVCERKI
uniref:CD209 antigen-like protein A n=1 Tax=Styela clava TaxID=7725 RepID=UPI00193A975B|nr:CD209 antigen-like protein A [Styela clava]